MFVKLNNRVHLNFNRITKTQIDHTEDEIRVRFDEGQYQVAKSNRFEKKEPLWLKSKFSI